MFKILGTLSAASILIPALAFLFFPYKKIRGYAGLLLFVLGSLVFEAIFRYTAFYKINNHFWSHPYTILEFGALFLYFYSYLKTRQNQAGLRIIAAVYLLFLMINPLLFEEFKKFNSVARSLNSVIFIGLSLAYLYKVFKEEQILHLELHPEFWIAAACLFYFSVSLFTLLLSSSLLFDYKQSIYTSFYFLWISNIVKNNLFFVALWTTRR